MATDTELFDLRTLIHSKPGVKGGRPCLAGTGMPVHSVAARYIRGLSAEEILREFPDLDLARIFAGLAYYFANKEQIEADLDNDARFADEMMAKQEMERAQRKIPSG